MNVPEPTNQAFVALVRKELADAAARIREMEADLSGEPVPTERTRADQVESVHEELLLHGSAGVEADSVVKARGIIYQAAREVPGHVTTMHLGYGVVLGFMLVGRREVSKPLPPPKPPKLPVEASERQRFVEELGKQLIDFGLAMVSAADANRVTRGDILYSEQSARNLLHEAGRRIGRRVETTKLAHGVIRGRLAA